MFVLLLITALICILTTALIRCQSIKWLYCRYTVSIVLALVIVLSSAGFAIDLISYLNGGIKTTQCATLSKTKLTENLYCFTVDNAYWSIGHDVKNYKMITIRYPKNMEIRFVEMDIFSEKNELIIYYLPLSKYFIKIKVL
jgi:hypothetical protein